MADEALDDEDDESLALKVAIDKCSKAAGLLVARYSPKLKGYLTAHFDKTLKEHGIQDAVQDTFRRMIQYIASYDRKVGPFEGWMIGIAYKSALKMLSSKDKPTYEAFTDEPVFEPPDPDCEDDGNDWRTKVLDDFVQKKLKGFQQAVARDYIATGGDIDARKLMREWGKTRNHVDVAKSVVKKKFMEELTAAEKQQSREKGKT